MVFIVFSCLVKEKNNYLMFLLASLKTLTISENCSESRFRTSVPALLLSLVNFLQFRVHVIPGFRNNFQNHRRPPEKKPEQAS